MTISKNIRSGVCLLAILLIPMALFWWVCTPPEASPEEAATTLAQPQAESTEPPILNKENYIIDLSYYFLIP
ncbi:MAG: hypothetical protein AAF571_12130 [Verrucomicrobiota bacterium]